MLSEQERQRLLDRCARELRRRALLVDPSRLLEILELQLAAHGRTPAAGDSVEGSQPSTSLVEDQAWLERRLSTAAEYALEIDAQRARGDAPLEDEDYEFLVDVFFLDPEEAAKAAHEFHCLPFEARRATIELLLTQRAVEECLEEGFAETPEELGALARRGLMALMRIDESMVEGAALGDSAPEEGETP